MEMDNEFDVWNIFYTLDHLINDSANKYAYYGYELHLLEYLELKQDFRESLGLKKDLSQIYLRLLEFIFKYDYLEIPYIPNKGRMSFSSNRNLKLNFTREMIEEFLESIKDDDCSI